MGPLMVSMPRTQYAGAFSMETASSKLIGSGSEESEATARHLASRLSQKLGVAVFVSCSFEEKSLSSHGLELDVLEHNTLQQRAVALAEREILRLLIDRFRN